MATRKPLVIGANGLPQQLQAQDSLAGAATLAARVTVDWGDPGRYSLITVVTVTGAVVGQKVAVSAAGDMPAGVSADELEMDMFSGAGAVTATDTVTLTLATSSGPISGQRNVNLLIS